MAAANGSLASRAYAVAAGVFLLVAPVTSSSGWRAAMLLVAALALAVSAARHERVLAGLCWPRAFVGWYAAWAALAAVSCLWSVSSEYSLSEWRREILYGALAFGVFYAGTADPVRWRRGCMILIAGAALLAVAELVRVAVGLRWLPRELHGGPGRFTTHLVIVAPLLTCLLHELPLGLGRRPALAVVALGVFFLAAFASGNRIVWIAFFAAFVVIAALARAPRAQAPWRVALITGFGALILALFALSIVQKAEDVYPDAANAGESLAMDLRPKLWGLAVDAVADRPLLGHGFGHEILADRFRAGIGTRGYEFASHGHNMFLNAAVSLGAVGLAILVAMLAALALAYRRLLAQPSTRFLGALGLAILAAFVAKNLTDDFFVRHNALVFWAVNGMLLGLGQRLDVPRGP